MEALAIMAQTYSVTDIQTYMRCQQKYELTSLNRQALEPIVKAPALALGTLIHKTLEDWSTQLYLDGVAYDDTDPLLIYDAYAKQALQDIITKYRDQVGVTPSAAELIGVTQAMNLGHAMIENYQAYWHEPVPKHLRLLKAEQTVIVPIPGTDDLFIEGTLDGLLVDQSASQPVYYIRENKTFGVHPTIEELQRNFQFLCYIWIARQAFDADVRGIAYDGLWKREHILNPQGKPRKRRDGTEYTQDDLFLRTTLVRSPKELDSLGPILAMMTTKMAEFPATLTPGSLQAPYRVVPPVRGCLLDDKQNIKLCDAIWRGEDTSYILKGYTKREKNYDEHETDNGED